MQVFKSVLSSVICLQLVLTSVVFSHPAMANLEAPINLDPGLAEAEKNDARKLKDIEKAIEDIDFSKLPRGHVDSFQVGGQEITFKNKKTGAVRVYSASEINVAIPELKIMDFEREVHVGVAEDGGLLFSFENTQWEVTHKVPAIRPLTAAVHKEMIGIVDEKGYISVMDSGHTRENVFKSVVFAVSAGHSQLTAGELANVKSVWVSPGAKPMKRSDNPRHVFRVGPVDPQREKLPFGDFGLYTEDHGARLQVGQFDGAEMQTYLAKGMADLGMVVFRLSPPEAAAKVLEDVDKSLGSESVVQMADVDPNEMSAVEREALMSMSTTELLARAKFHQAPRERGSMTRAEHEFIFPKLLEAARSATGNSQEHKDLRAAVERGELGNTWQTAVEIERNAAKKEYNDPRPLYRRMLDSRGMKIFAVISAGAAAGLVADGIITPQQAWSVYLLNLTGAADLFPVLKDAHYRFYLGVSSVALLTFIPMSYIVGMMNAKSTMLTASKALVKKTANLYAEIGLPVYHRIIRMMRQPNFMRAMAQGTSPFKTITPESPIGRRMGLEQGVRPGLSNPFAPELERERVDNDKAKVLNEVARQKIRVRSLAWLLALQAVGREYNIDPATMAAMNAENGFMESKLDELAKDKKFQKVWAHTAEELEIELKKIARNLYIEDFKKIDLKELDDMIEKARVLAKQIKSRDFTGRVLGSWKRAWNNFGSRSRMAFANFGMKDYKLLKNSTPSDFVVSEFWKQFILDYVLAVGQIAIVGDRANPEHPEALAADPESPWTAYVRRAHLFDMWEQIQTYVIQLPAITMIQFQDPAQVRERSFEPFEMISMEGKRRTTTLLGGYWKWLKLTLDPTKMDEFGQKGLASFLGRVRTVQYGLVVTTIGRWAVAGQDFTKALAAFTYWELERRWSYAWPWDIVMVGNNRYQQDAANNKAALLAARRKISEGVRVDDAAMFIDGSNELIALQRSDKKAVDFDSRLNEALTGLEKLSDADFQALRSTYGPYVTAINNLTLGLYSGSAQQISSAREELEKAYADQGLGANAAARAQLGAIDLLQYSLKNPPFATDHHKGVTWSSTLALGAIPTTYWATTLAVFTFDPFVQWGPTIGNSLVRSLRNYAIYYYGTKLGAKASRYIVGKSQPLVEGWKERSRAKLEATSGGRCNAFAAQQKKASGE